MSDRVGVVVLAISQSFKEFVLEQLMMLGDVTVQNMLRAPNCLDKLNSRRKDKLCR